MSSLHITKKIFLAAAVIPLAVLATATISSPFGALAANLALFGFVLAIFFGGRILKAIPVSKATLIAFLMPPAMIFSGLLFNDVLVELWLELFGQSAGVHAPSILSALEMPTPFWTIGVNYGLLFLAFVIFLAGQMLKIVPGKTAQFFKRWFLSTIGFWFYIMVFFLAFDWQYASRIGEGGYIIFFFQIFSALFALVAFIELPILFFLWKRRPSAQQR